MATAAKTQGKHKNGKKARHSEVTDSRPVNNGTRPPMTAKEFERELEPLQEELVKLQEWVKATGAKICIVFEGRDAAGKGGTIKRITERVSPRVFRVMALPAPTEREKSQMYIQRYLQHFPAAGEVVIFDRSWYNRAGVERVMGYATEEQVKSFLDHVVDVERAMIASGIILIKYWLEVEPEEQTRRLQDRIEDGRKTWKLSPMDLESYGRWYDYSRARDRNVRRLGHAGNTLARCRFQRKAPRPAELHRPPLEPNSVPRDTARESQVAQAPVCQMATSTPNTPTASSRQRY